jgi:hypothetical protein
MNIAHSDHPWGAPHRGLQMFGRAFRVGEGDLARAFRVYAAAHPDIRTVADDLEALHATSSLRLYGVSLTHLKVVDEPDLGEDPVTVTLTSKLSACKQDLI